MGSPTLYGVGGTKPIRQCGGTPMPIYAISYDLNAPDQRYQRVKEAIESCGESIRPMESFWLVDSHLPSWQISDKVKSAHDSNDLHLVMAVTADHSGWLPPYACEWLRQRQNKRK